VICCQAPKKKKRKSTALKGYSTFFGNRLILHFYENRLNGLKKNGKTQLFNSGGVVKGAYFQKKKKKKWSVPLIGSMQLVHLIQSASSVVT